MYISNNRQVIAPVTNHKPAKKKKKREKTPKSESSRSRSSKSFGKVLGSPRLIQIYGVILIIFSLLLLVSIISYFYTFDLDFENCIERNWAGVVGAYLARFFVKWIFGLSSFGFPFLFFLYGVKLTFEKSLLPLLKTTIGTFLTMAWISMLFGLIINPETVSSSLLAGYFGQYMVQELMIPTVKLFVTVLILLLFLLIILILCYNFSVQNCWEKMAGLSRLFHLNHKEKNSKGSSLSASSSGNHLERQELPGLYIEQRDGLSKEVKGEVYEFETKVQSPSNITGHEEFMKSCAESLAHHEDEVKKADVPFEISNSEVVPPAAEQKNEEPQVEQSKEENATESVQQTSSMAILPMEDYDPRKDLSTYQFPTLDLLNEYEMKAVDKALILKELRENKEKIERTLNNFKIPITKITATIGPTVTLYEIVPDAGIRISKIKGLEDDIALSLAALGIRIIAPIPGKGTIGIEVPNKNAKTVSMREIIASDKFQNNKYDLPLGLGKTISDEPFVVDLAKMPHLLVAGATGQGKSVGLNAIITSLLYKKHPAELKLVMVDPKKLEFSLYSLIEKHYLAMLPDAEEPIITDTKKVVRTLNSLCVEMDARYDLMKLAQTRNIKEYNAKFCARQLSPTNGHRYLPYIVVVIDEFGDLIITAGREVEVPITRLAQLARACGIHLIIATQRPTTTIITGNIKGNFPARIAFRVGAKIDSRVILDQNGADQLIGKGDMLISTGSDLVRLQCAFVDTPEVERIVNHISDQQSYPEPFYLPEYAEEEPGINDVEAEGGYTGKIDSCFMDAATLIVQTQQGSTSLIQRKMNLGYNRAGRIMDQLEEFNIVGPSMGSKAREVKVHTLEELRLILQQMGII